MVLEENQGQAGRKSPGMGAKGAGDNKGDDLRRCEYMTNMPSDSDADLGGRLRGREAISGAYGRSWKIVKRLIDAEGFPAMIEFGEWVSNKQAIHDWEAARIRKPRS